LNFCTLFNSQYLSRGLALYYSLLKNAKNFHLYIFAFDDEVFQILSALNLQAVTLISLRDFETPDLLRVKKERTMGEYCWTCTSSTILYCLEKYQLSDICYLDADLYFWQDPAILLEEARHDSILITEHRYTKEYDHSAVSGKYCVQFMYFKNDQYGLEALKWWRDACIEWCYNRVEPGRFGDQKYLDDWLERFKKVKVLTHLGGGVAPWNVQQYEVDLTSTSSITLIKRDSKQKFDLIFYHFHGLKFVNQQIDFGTYKLSKNVIKEIYEPYVKALFYGEQVLMAHKDISVNLKSINLHCKATSKFSLREYARNVKKKLLGIYNIFPAMSFRS